MTLSFRMATPLPAHVFHADCEAFDYECRDHLDACRDKYHGACKFDEECLDNDLECLDENNRCTCKFHDACVLSLEEHHADCQACGGECLDEKRCDNMFHSAYMAPSCWCARERCLNEEGLCTDWEHNSFRSEC